jgi:3-methyladenine DNA glycosylase AlkD
MAYKVPHKLLKALDNELRENRLTTLNEIMSIFNHRNEFIKKTELRKLKRKIKKQNDLLLELKEYYL